MEAVGRGGHPDLINRDQGRATGRGQEMYTECSLRKKNLIIAAKLNNFSFISIRLWA